MEKVRILVVLLVWTQEIGIVDKQSSNISATCKLGKDRSIVSIVYDEKNDVVRVSGTFDPNALRRTLKAKLRGIINDLDIQGPPPPEEPKPEPPPPPPQLDPPLIPELPPTPPKPLMYPWPPPPGELIPEPPPPPPQLDPPPKPPMYPWPPKPPMYPWPPQVTMVCFARPCSCLTVWSNNYWCCSCRVESWPGRCRSGSGSRCGSGPRHGDHPQWGCEPSQQPNIAFESTPNITYESSEPSCSIM